MVPTTDPCLTTRQVRAYLNKRLVRACQTGDVYTVQEALRNGASVNYRDFDGMSPLHWAVDRNDYNIATCLLQTPGIQVDCLDRFKCTPLSVACEKSCLPMVDLLLRHGANVNHADIDGWTPMHWTRCVAVAHRLLQERNVNIDSVDQEGESPLHLKVDDGDLLVAAFLLDKGADVNFPNKDGWTPLQTATQNLDLDMAYLLLRNGASLCSECVKGNSPLMTTCRTGVDYVPMDMALGMDDGVAIIDGDDRCKKRLAMAQLLLENGADPTRIHTRGLSALHYVCELGQATDILRVMLDFCHDVNVVTKDGMTPLHSACRGGNVEMVQILLHRGANAMAKSNDGRTPWMVACEGNHVNVVRLLLQGISLDQESSAMILHYACQCHCLDVVRMLCEDFQMQVDCKNGGISPLESACANARLDTIMYLLRDHSAFFHLGSSGRMIEG